MTGSEKMLKVLKLFERRAPSRLSMDVICVIGKANS